MPFGSATASNRAAIHANRLVDACGYLRPPCATPGLRTRPACFLAGDAGQGDGVAREQDPAAPRARGMAQIDAAQ